MPHERVVVLSGPMQGTAVEIVGALTLGRSHDSGLQINDLQVSRKHAVIQQGPNGCILRDLGSGNGTYVGNRRVVEYRLSDGDVFSVGPVDLRFESRATQPGEGTGPSQNVVFRAAGDEQAVRASTAEAVYQTLFRGGGESGELQEARARLAALYQATQTISSEHDIKRLLAKVMDQLFELAPAHNGVILLKSERTGELRTEYVRTGSGAGDVVQISSSIVQRAFEQGEAVLTYNAAVDDRFGAGASIIAQNITSAMCAPLEHQGEPLGVVYLDTRGTTNAFSEGDLELVVALARAAAIAIRNAEYLRQREQAYRDTLIVLSNAIEMRDHYTVGHTWRVTQFAMEIGRKLGWDDAKIEECQMGGILHDVGKIAVDDAILGKPGGLTDEEFAKMKVHPERGARLMQDVEFLIPLIPYALYHHERWDGKGYPFGLKGEEIPLEGRVVAVADTYDAMTSNRPYRKGLDPDVALEEICKKSGTQFDPQCVEALAACHQDGSIKRVLQNYYEADGRSFACPFCSTYIRIPDEARPDTELVCNVCHRRLMVRFRNNAFYGELLAETEPHAPLHPAEGPATVPRS